MKSLENRIKQLNQEKKEKLEAINSYKDSIKPNLIDASRIASELITQINSILEQRVKKNANIIFYYDDKKLRVNKHNLENLIKEIDFKIPHGFKLSSNIEFVVNGLSGDLVCYVVFKLETEDTTSKFSKDWVFNMNLLFRWYKLQTLKSN